MNENNTKIPYIWVFNYFGTFFFKIKIPEINQKKNKDRYGLTIARVYLIHLC